MYTCCIHVGACVSVCYVSVCFSVYVSMCGGCVSCVSVCFSVYMCICGGVCVVSVFQCECGCVYVGVCFSVCCVSVCFNVSVGMYV